MHAAIGLSTTGDQLLGIAAVITAIGVITGQYFTALAAHRAQKASEANAAKIDDVHDAVRTTNGATIGELLEATETRRIDDAGS